MRRMATNHTSHSEVAFSVITPSAALVRKQSKRRGDYSEVPQGRAQAPDQYSISVILPHIIIPDRAAR